MDIPTLLCVPNQNYNTKQSRLNLEETPYDAYVPDAMKPVSHYMNSDKRLLSALNLLFTAASGQVFQLTIFGLLVYRT